MGKPKQTSSNKDKAEAEYTISNWDAKGRAKLDQLAKEKEKVSQRMYEKCDHHDAYDRYLLDTHLVAIRKRHSLHEKQRSAAEDQRVAEEEARNSRAARRKSDSTERTMNVVIQLNGTMKRTNGVTLRQYYYILYRFKLNTILLIEILSA